MVDKQLETLAYRLRDISTLRNLFSELNFDFADKPVNKDNWNDDQKKIVQEARIIASKDDYQIYYIQTNTDSLNQWKGISSKIIKDNHGLCMICSHNPSGFKWVFSSLSKEFSKSFSETRHVPIDIKPDIGVPKTFVDFLEKIKVSKDSTGTSIVSQISEAFDSFAVTIHDELTVNVFEALKSLSEGIILEESNGLTLDEKTLEEIREPIFILLYRIIFILYAEDRGIFPTEQKIYHEKFSFKWLKDEWLLKSENQKKLAEYQVHERLWNFFRLIELGSEDLGYDNKEFFMRSYYGRIFDKNINKKLDKWKIKNHHLLDAISLLTRTHDKKGNYFFLDYSALETRHLGSIYEHLLEYHLTVKGKKIADLPDQQDRKTSGSYYTPQYIVDYIVQNTIEPLIDKIRKDTNDKFEQIEKILSLNILDPAMGSGHFLIGVVNYIAKRICEIEDEEITEHHLNERKRDVARRCVYGVDINPLAVDLAMVSLWLETLSSEKPLSFLSAHLKCGNTLIGSEIDTLFNKQTTLMESQKGREQFKRTIKDFLMFENLDDDSPNSVKVKIEKYQKIQSKGTIYYNIKSLLDCKVAEFFGVKIPVIADFKAKIGENSLDFFTDELWQKIQQRSLQHRFFHWDLEFPDIFYDINSKKIPNSGFDCVVGNPPYVKEDKHREIFEDVKKSNMKKYYQGKMDYWYFFSCHALDLLKDGGYHSIIAQNNWGTSYGAKILRNKILNDSKFTSFIDFNEFMVFEDAVIQTMVFVLQKMKKIPKIYFVNYDKVTKKDITKEQIKNYLVNKGDYDGIENCLVKFEPSKCIDNTITLTCSEVSSILDKIIENSNRKLTSDEIGNGIDVLQDSVSKDHLKKLKDSKISKGDGIFVLSTKEKTEIKFNKKELEKIKPFYTPEELKKYFSNAINEYWIIYADKEVQTNITKYPNIQKHLDKFKPVLTSVHKPYGLHRSRAQELFEDKGIFCLRKTKEPSFTYTDFPCYVARSFMILKPIGIDYKFLIGLLNSKLSYFVFYYDGKKQGEQLQIDKQPLLDFPIKLPKTKQEEKMLENVIKFVDLIKKTRIEMDKIRIEREKQIVLQKIQSFEDQIDENIFQLYGLLDEDIKIINSSL